MIAILLRHLGLEASGEIAVRMRTSVFKEYGQYLSLQANIGRNVNVNVGRHLIPQTQDDVVESQSNFDFWVSLV